jgi:hypothetical protein
VFSGTHTSVVLEQLRIPYSLNLDQTSRVSLLSATASGRSLVHPRVPAPAFAPERRLGDLRFFAPALADASLLALLPAGDWRPGEEVVDGAGTAVAHVWRNENGDVALPFDPDAALVNLWSEAYAAAPRSRALKRTAMRTYYRLRPLMPRALQIALRRRFAVIQARASFPRWPIETAAHDLFDLILALLEEVAGEPVPWIAPWPGQYRWALVLTHDVEQQAGCDNVPLLRDLEETRGYRSAWNFVPRRYDTPDATVRELWARGFEVGVHGLYHDGRDLESRELLLERLPAMHEAASRWSAGGFRSPATHRDWELMPLLGFDHDSSYLDTDPFEPQGGGSCTWWPFPIGELIELPITLLMDHTLFVILRRDESVWEAKARFLRERGGMALLITHPDYMLEDKRLAVYDRFLATFEHDETMWRALPSEVAAWWRRRGDTAPRRDGEAWRLAGPAAEDARLVFGPRI